jgi:hypothetical protein
MKTYDLRYERFETTRRQLANPTSHRQLRTPADLQVGQDIALLERNYADDTPLWARLGCVGIEYLKGLLTDKKANQVLGAMRRSWQSTGPSAVLVPQWRGIVRAVHADRADIKLTHQRVGEDFGWDEYPNAPEQIPALANPSHGMVLTEGFDELGLAPLPKGQRCAGRWLLSTLVEITPPQSA